MDGIAVAIEDSYDVPAKFRDQLKEHLRSLVASGKLAKNKNTFSVPTAARGGVVRAHIPLTCLRFCCRAAPRRHLNALLSRMP